MAHLLEKFRRDIAGILWIAFAVFLALALYSFHPTDPSFNSISKGGTAHVENLCGYFGSFLSDLLYQLLGLAAWVIVLGALRLSVFSFRGKPFVLHPTRFGGAAILILVSASLGALYFPQLRFYNDQISVGGLLGTLVSRGLVGIFNKTGVGIILWTSVTVLIIFYTEKRLAEMFPWIQRAVKSFFWTLSQWLPQKKGSTDVFVAGTEKKELLGAVAPKFFLKRESGPAIKTTESEKGKLARLKEAIRKTPRQVENWQLPTLDLLLDPPGGERKIDEREIGRNARLVEQKLAEFDVLGQVVEVKPGPAVTMYEFRPAASIKINDITKLADDLSLALSAESLRIIAPIPGRDVVGIETSNSSRNDIYMKDLMEAPEFWSDEIKLPIALGKTVTGEPKIIDLRKIPHLLVAGTTGSGKSIFIMSLVTSLITRHSPKTLRLIIVDPKQVDLAAFHRVPHLLMPPVKDAKPAINTLKWLIREMEKRYRSMSQFNSKSIEAYNEATKKLSSEDLAQHEEKIKAFEENPQTTGQTYYCKPLPYVVAVIEEFADLMSVDKGGVEPAVVRLAQMARASGIHLVIAMQSPRREVLTGLIKTNFPGRICFKVASKVDSSIVLDQRGAERLLSVGDMLYLAPGVSQPQRYHGAYLRDEEVSGITEFWIHQGEPQYETAAVSAMESDPDLPGQDGPNPDLDEDYDQVVEFVVSQKEVSASLIQRRFRFGYPKAARLIEILEHEGIVGPSNGSKPRQVLANKLD